LTLLPVALRDEAVTVGLKYVVARRQVREAVRSAGVRARGQRIVETWVVALSHRPQGYRSFIKGLFRVRSVDVA
jgi:hypothetical protein